MIPLVLKSLSSEVILENTKLPEGVSITYKSICKNGVEATGENGRKCSNISIGDEVHTILSVAICVKKIQPVVLENLQHHKTRNARARELAAVLLYSLDGLFLCMALVKMSLLNLKKSLQNKK